MHVRWRGLELPAKVTLDGQSRSQTFGRFTAEPFERGFGITVGNSLRRILLSSLEGAAISKVSIKSQGKMITHEFSTIPGVLEDVTDILLNIKGLIVSMEGDEPKTLRLAAEGPGDVTAELIEGDASVTIHNPEKLIATLTDAVDFECTFTVKKGRGYEPASDQYGRDIEQVIGEIPIDAIFSPVQRVRYACEDTRVGQRTNYQKLVLDVWTNGTVSPEMALVEAAKIMRKHLNPFVQFEVAGDATVSSEVLGKAGADEELYRKLNMPVTDLELSVRASNCLESAKIQSVSELVQKTEDDLLAVRSFGKTSLREVKSVLESMGLSLGMQLPEGYSPA
ncbi:MAG: DNA-directed RNA polymerase subunit alpha [Phycisphaerae bacterium]|jgi:DNA-directed RNA polymerase subunit alpha|nr:DNA-directed RNA polymerase subunit alpha [Phycisphaerae bacterium]